MEKTNVSSKRFEFLEFIVFVVDVVENSYFMVLWIFM